MGTDVAWPCAHLCPCPWRPPAEALLAGRPSSRAAALAACPALCSQVSNQPASAVSPFGGCCNVHSQCPQGSCTCHSSQGQALEGPGLGAHGLLGHLNPSNPGCMGFLGLDGPCVRVCGSRAASSEVVGPPILLGQVSHVTDVGCYGRVSWLCVWRVWGKKSRPCGRGAARRSQGALFCGTRGVGRGANLGPRVPLSYLWCFLAG